MQEAHGAPGRFIGQTDLADLAGAYQLIQRLQYLFQRGEVLLLMAVAELAEVVGASLRPMQLVEIQIVGLQALEAGVECRVQMGAIVLELAVANVVDAVAGAGDLACQYPLGAGAACLEVAADDALGAAIGFCSWRDGVHLGCVEEVDAACPGQVELGEGVRFGILLAPGHAAEADLADVDVAFAESSQLHRYRLFC